MKKIIGIFVAVSIFFSVLCMPVFAQNGTTTTTTTTSTAQEIIEALQQLIEQIKAQIAEVIAQIESLKQAKLEIKETAKEIKETLKLTKQMWEGMSDEDVALLQEFLATDPEIYPEGLITGYFGPLTKNAVKRFQKLAGIEQVGRVGPKTLSKINELLEEGAGKSGKVPPGLLIAPGIRKKLGFEPQPLEGQVLPPGISSKISTTATSTEEEEDTTAPVISGILAASTTATSSKITWITDEEADSKVWYSTSTSLEIATSTLSVSSADLVENHELELTGLTASTTYYYIVSSTDESDNEATSSEMSFITLAE